MLENAYEVEQRIFTVLNNHRETGEFFRLSQDKAVGRIEALLFEWGSIDASGMSPAGLRERERQLAEQRRNDENLQRRQQRIAAKQEIQQQFDSDWEKGWAKHVEAWCRLNYFCGVTMKGYSHPGFIYKLINGNDYNSSVDHLRHWKNYNILLSKISDMILESRNVKEFILSLKSKYGNINPSGWDNRGPCSKMINHSNTTHWFETPMLTWLSYDKEKWPELEVRFATQSVFCLAGDAATILLEREYNLRNQLLTLVSNRPPPEEKYRTE